jgi:ArsR family transcriptional regulator, arsenate/arsenite/antimonite-responsive transcriptional repressor
MAVPPLGDGTGTIHLRALKGKRCHAGQQNRDRDGRLREGHLTTIRQFHILGIMKTIARLPLAQLSADETHVEAFKALAHLSRLQVFFLLVKAGREMSVGEIQEAVEIPGPTLSHHLDILRRAGLIESRKEERYIYYSVQRERVTALVRLLTACC